MNSLSSLGGVHFPKHIMDILATAFLDCCELIHMTYLQIAVSLLRKSVTTSDSTKRSILLILSQFYLSQAENKRESNSYVYLAVLHYITGQYQTAIEYCNSKANSCYVVEGRCLPTIDENTDNALGLVVLYQFVQSKLLRHFHRQLQHFNGFSAQLLSYYLLYSLKERKTRSLHKMMNRFHSREFTAVDLLVVFLARSKHYVSSQSQATKSNEPLSIQFTVSELRQLVLPYSVEQMTLFQETISHDYQSEGKIVTSDIQAMYAIKCGKHHQCLQLSQENVDRLWNETRFHSVILFGPMTHLTNDDLSCFSAVCRLRRGGYTPDTNILYPAVFQLTLSIYLTIKSKLKLRHSAASLIRDLQLARILHRRHPAENITERLLLSFIYRKTIITIRRKL